MELVQKLISDVLSVSVLKLVIGVGIAAALCFTWGWRAWKRDAMDRFSDNVLGAHGLASLTLLIILWVLFIRHYGFLRGAPNGLFLGTPLALLLGYLFRWFILLNAGIAVWIAQRLEVPQTGYFNDPAVVAKIGGFLRNAASNEMDSPPDERSAQHGNRDQHRPD